MTDTRTISEYNDTVPAPNEHIRLTNEQYLAARLLEEGPVLCAYMVRGVVQMETENGEDCYSWSRGGWIIDIAA